MLNKYDDFYLDLILEKIINKEIPLVLSDNFRSLIDQIKHPISYELLDMDMHNAYEFKLSYVDLDESGLDKVSFSISTKSIETISKHYGFSDDVDTTLTKDDFRSINHNSSLLKDLFSKNRSVTTIGKLINKLFPKKYPANGKPGEDIETFVNQFKSKRDVNSNFELVKGEDIKHWYHEDQYFGNEGPLNGSCMRYDECQNYINFYVLNPHAVSLLILKSTEADEDEDDIGEKIIGRALVWKLDYPENRYFMDRIYYVKDYIIDQFKNYAKEKGWLYKFNQNMQPDEYIVDPLTDKQQKMNLIVRQMENDGYYPYMDTFKYYDYDYGILSNDKKNMESSTVYLLEDTDGEYMEEEMGEWSDYYGEYIDPDDLIYCEYGDDYRKDGDYEWLDYYNVNATTEYIEQNMVACDYYDGYDAYRDESDTVSVYGSNEIACEDYARNNMTYSDYLGEYLPEGDEVWSDYHNSYLYRPESIEVYTDAEQHGKDWRDDDDGTWYEGPDGEYYDEDVELDEDDE